LQVKRPYTDGKSEQNRRGGLSFVQAQGLGVHVNAMATTRFGGMSQPPYDSLNLGEHVHDDPVAVRENRTLLRQWLPGEPVWLNQVHGRAVFDADTSLTQQDDRSVVPTADAAVTTLPGRVLAVLTADCMPVVLASEGGEVVGIAHAGWRGLAEGVLETTVEAMRKKCLEPVKICAWIGPCIGPDAFQVGSEVRARFMETAAELAIYFSADPSADGKWLADLPAIAMWQLEQLGIADARWCGLCTVADTQHCFYSYRREGHTGRMATLVWINRLDK
jgi:YfiH family protein